MCVYLSLNHWTAHDHSWQKQIQGSYWQWIDILIIIWLSRFAVQEVTITSTPQQLWTVREDDMSNKAWLRGEDHKGNTFLNNLSCFQAMTALNVTIEIFRIEIIIF